MISVIDPVRWDDVTCTTIVRPLRGREAAFWPSIRSTIGIEKGVLLFETEPWFLLYDLVHDFFGMVAVVGSVRRSVIVVGLGEDENVVTAAERVLEDGSRSKVDVRVVAGSLVCG